MSYNSVQYYPKHSPRWMYHSPSEEIFAKLNESMFGARVTRGHYIKMDNCGKTVKLSSEVLLGMTKKQTFQRNLSEQIDTPCIRFKGLSLSGKWWVP